VSRDGHGITIDGTLDHCARVAVWFRSLVPVEHEVRLYDDGNSSDAEVLPAMSPEELVTAFETAAHVK
jgi:hypothetical protein